MSTQTINQPEVDIVLPPNTDVRLTILIGYAQMGGSIVKFNGATTPLAKGTVKDLSLGNSDTLKGKTLLITSKVLDSNAATMHFLVTHDFSVGNQKHFVQNGSFKSAGDTLIWNTTYNFK